MKKRDYSTAKAIEETLARLNHPASTDSNKETPLSTVAPETRKQHKLVNNFLKTVTTIMAILALLITGSSKFFLINYWDGKIHKVDVLDKDDSSIKDSAAQTGDENILLVGVDSRYGKNAEVGAGDTSEVEGVRSDTIILLHIPANKSRAVAISFPRDLQVDRPECEKWDYENETLVPDEYVPAENNVKLNSTYSYGGPRCLIKVIQSIIGLQITRFAAVDFVGFKKMIDLIGGVEVCTTKPLIDDELGIVLYKRGYQKLYGGRALNYVRARHVEGETASDYDRIKRQQTFLSSVIQSMFSSGVLKNPSKLNKLIDAFAQNSYMDGLDANDLYQLAASLDKLDLSKTSFITLPTETITTPEYTTSTVEVETKGKKKNKTVTKEVQELSGYNYQEIPLTDEIEKISNDLINDEALPNEKSDSSTSDEKHSDKDSTQLSGKTVDPKKISVIVTNGTGETGLATNTAAAIEKYGVQIATLETLDYIEANLVIRYPSNLSAEALTLAAMFPGAKVKQDNSLDGQLNLILGTAFKKNIKAPLAAGSDYTVDYLSSSSTADSTAQEPDIAAKITNAKSSICI